MRAARSVFASQGGYDENIPGMEDKDFQIAVHANGFCAYHIDEPLFVYRMYSSTKREKDYNKIAEIEAYMNTKWSDYKNGEKKMGCGCGTKTSVQNGPSSLMSSSGNFDMKSLIIDPTQPASSQMVMLEYIGPVQETFSLKSTVNRDVTYRFGNNDYHRQKAVYLQDAERFMGMVNSQGQPLYIMVVAGATMEVRDPTSFLGAPVEMA